MKNRRSIRTYYSSLRAGTIYCTVLTSFMIAFGALATIRFQFSSLPSTNNEADAITPMYHAKPYVDLKAVATDLQTQHQEQKVMRPSSSSLAPSTLLRFDWTNLTLISGLARRMAAHQSNCSLPLGNFVYRNRYGLGSDLHVWGQALCNGLESNVRVRTVGSWTWVDQQACKTTDPALDLKAPTTTIATTPMTCYFPTTEIQCLGDTLLVREHPTFDSAVYNISRPNGVVKVECDSILEQVSKPELRTAVVEYLFSHVSELVVREADRQASLVFREAPGGKAPPDLITVHIRWGDKAKEMKLVPIQDYIQAVQKILKQRHAASTTESGLQSSLEAANILLATEDPAVVEEFQKLIPSTWRVYVDQYFYDMLPHRVAEYNGSPKMSALLEGKPGLKALGSLLVCMEANDFVLTTASNWSRLMNELRTSILDPRCNNCTTMIDLRRVRGEW
jgi:hypothetical protein